MNTLCLAPVNLLMNPTSQPIDIRALKQQAAEEAVQQVHSGMIIGLGVGSTTIFAVRKIGRLVRQGKLQHILGIPCSPSVAEEAQKVGIPLTTLEEHPHIDLTIDGADEVDPHLNLIKGGGGALLREKIVAQATQREVIVVDESKLSPILGTHWPLPVEVLPFGLGSAQHFLKSLGAAPVLRLKQDGQPWQTDQGNFILDAHFGPIQNLLPLATELDAQAAIIAHGLFLNIASEIIVAAPTGIQHISKSHA